MQSHKRIDPITTGELRVNVADLAGVAVTTATVVATITGPLGVVAEAVPLTNAGGGAYTLVIEPAWSTKLGGKPVQGPFRALVTATVVDSPENIVHTSLFHWMCAFDDD